MSVVRYPIPDTGIGLTLKHTVRVWDVVPTMSYCMSFTVFWRYTLCSDLGAWEVLQSWWNQLVGSRSRAHGQGVVAVSAAVAKLTCSIANRQQWVKAAWRHLQLYCS